MAMNELVPDMFLFEKASQIVILKDTSPGIFHLSITTTNFFREICDCCLLGRFCLFQNRNCFLFYGVLKLLERKNHVGLSF